MKKHWASIRVPYMNPTLLVRYSYIKPHARLGRWMQEEFSSGPHVHNDGQRTFTAVLFRIQHVPHRAWNSNAHSVAGFKNNYGPGNPILQLPESTGLMASVFAVVSGGEGHKAILNEKLSGEWSSLPELGCCRKIGAAATSFCNKNHRDP